MFFAEDHLKWLAAPSHIALSSFSVIREIPLFLSFVLALKQLLVHVPLLTSKCYPPWHTCPFLGDLYPFLLSLPVRLAYRSAILKMVMLIGMLTIPVIINGQV